MQIKNRSFPEKFLLAWAAAGIILALATSAMYLLWPGFGEQGEVNFASVAWLVSNGQPLYTDVDAAQRYSLQHGPIVYLLVGGIMQLLGPSYVTAKLSGVVMFWLILGLSFVMFKRAGGKRNALIFTGLEAWLLFHWHNSCYIRPDAMLVVCMLISLYAITCIRNKTLMLAICAVVFGLMINLKVHGVIYLLPLLVLLTKFLTVKRFLAASLLTAFVGGLPFLLPQVSFSNYVFWIQTSVQMAAGDPASTLYNFAPKLAALLILILFPYCFAVVRGISLYSFCRHNRMVLKALLLGLLAASIIGSKPGSGTNHLMPLIPFYCYLLLRLSQEKPVADLAVSTGRIWRRRISGIVLGMLFLLVTLGGAHKELTLLKMAATDDRRPVLQELAELENAYAGKTMEIGYGEKGNRVITDCIPQLVFHGQPLLIEKVAFGDMLAVKVPLPAATVEALREGYIQVWLIPEGQEPFAWMKESEFPQAFLENYRHEGKSAHFDIWVYKQKM